MYFDSIHHAVRNEDRHYRDFNNHLTESYNPFFHALSCLVAIKRQLLTAFFFYLSANCSPFEFHYSKPIILPVFHYRTMLKYVLLFLIFLFFISLTNMRSEIMR